MLLSSFVGCKPCWDAKLFFYKDQPWVNRLRSKGPGPLVHHSRELCNPVGLLQTWCLYEMKDQPKLRGTDSHVSPTLAPLLSAGLGTGITATLEYGKNLFLVVSRNPQIVRSQCSLLVSGCVDWSIVELLYVDSYRMRLTPMLNQTLLSLFMRQALRIFYSQKYSSSRYIYIYITAFWASACGLWPP